MYNVIYNNCAGKMYHVFSRNHVGKNKSRSNDYVQPDLTSWENTTCSYILFIRLHIIQWMIYNRAFLWFCTQVPGITAHTHTHLHKILPHAHHTPIHTHMIIHTNILQNTYIQKIPPQTHHTPLHTNIIIHKNILTRLPVTNTRKYYTYKKLPQYLHLTQLHRKKLRIYFNINTSQNKMQHPCMYHN